MPSVSLKVSVLCVAAATALVPPGPHAKAAPAPCDAVLLDLASGRFPYSADTAGYCEGTYTRPVALKERPRFPGATTGSILEIVSVASRFEQFTTFERFDSVTLSWPPLASGAVSIRVRSFEHRVFYQMDASVAAGQAVFRWPAKVLISEEIPPTNIGVNAWGRTLDGADSVVVHLPVSVSRARSAGGPYTLVIVPSQTLETLTVSIVGRSAGATRVAKDLPPRGRSPFFAGRTIIVPLDVAAGGLYHVEIGATSRSGGSDAEELLIVLPAP